MKRTCRNRKRCKKSTQRKRRVLRAGAWLTGKSSTLDILNGMDDEQIGILGRDMEEIAERRSGIPFFEGSQDKDVIIQTYSEQCHNTSYRKRYCDPFKTLVAAIADPGYYKYKEVRERIIDAILMEIDYSIADMHDSNTAYQKARGVVVNPAPASESAVRRAAADRVRHKYKGSPAPTRRSTWFEIP